MVSAGWFVALTLMGCRKAPPAANPEFSDATQFAFASFEADEADLAFALRALEEQIYLSMDVDAAHAADRALTPAHLTEAQVDVEHPDRPLASALPVAVAGLSAFSVEAQAVIPLLRDQSPVEPYSPDHYERVFLEGEDCWLEVGCSFLRTDNDITKDNALMTVTYPMYKDFRWVDLSLPDPAAEEDYEVQDVPRLAFVGRAWLTEPAIGDKESSTIQQSFSLDVWIPREDGGTLRMMALWAETTFDGVSFSDDLVAVTTREGIDGLFSEYDRWLEENGG